MQPLPTPRPSAQLETDLETLPLTVGGTLGPLGLTRGEGWQLVLNDVERRSFLSYKPSTFIPGLLNKWYYQCVNDLPWLRPWVRGQLLNRKACWLTTGDAHRPYVYGGMKWPSFNMPEWFMIITHIVCDECGVTLEHLPNSCNANYYESGDDAVGWHADNEPLFQADKRDAMIISLSLGATRTFSYRLGNTGRVENLPLRDGDICTMEGLMQKYYHHAVPHQHAKTLGRINLTWRWVVPQ